MLSSANAATWCRVKILRLRLSSSAKLSQFRRPSKKHQGSYETLTANLDPYGDRKAFFQNFWFGKIVGLDGEYMADFGQVMTVSWMDYDHTLKNKIAELDDLHRAMFRVKVGAHFGRVTEEDKAAGFEDPYGRTDCPAPPPIPYREKVRQAMRLLIGRD